MSLAPAGLPRQLSALFPRALVWPQCGRGLTTFLVSPGAALYSRLKEYLLMEGQLKENSYPFPHPKKPGGAVIFTAGENKPKDSSCRICCHCSAEYLVSSSGRCVREEECYYHWGRLRRNRGETPAGLGWSGHLL